MEIFGSLQNLSERNDVKAVEGVVEEQISKPFDN
jgi:hypothetical protein